MATTEADAELQPWPPTEADAELQPWPPTENTDMSNALHVDVTITGQDGQAYELDVSVDAGWPEPLAHAIGHALIDYREAGAPHGEPVATGARITKKPAPPEGRAG